MSILSSDLIDAVRARSVIQTLAEENANLRFALKRLVEARTLADPDEWRLAEMQARAQLRQSELNARARR